MMERVVALYQATQQNNLSLYRPYDKQSIFHAAGVDKAFRLFLAGNRCGKTYCGAAEMAMHLTGRYPEWWTGKRFTRPITGWLAGVSFGQPMESLMQIYMGGIEDIDFGKGAIPRDAIVGFRRNKQSPNVLDTLRIKHKSGGVSTLKFMAYQQGREKFQSAKVDFIHMDEEPDEGIFAECAMRLAGTGGGIILTMTPLKGMSDTCMAFLEADEEEKIDKFYITAGWDDNPYLSEVDKRILKSGAEPHLLEARSKGIPALGSGRIYPVKEEDLEVDPFEIPRYFKLVAGMDFGWSNPTAVVFGAIDPDTGIVYIYHEYYKAERSPLEHTAAIRDVLKGAPIVCDPKGENASQADGTNLIEQYRDLKLDITPADNSVESGLMKVLTAMQTGKLKIFKGRCPNLLKEFRLYQRDEKGRVKKTNDHLMDATRYLIVSGLELARAPQNTLSAGPKRERPNWRTV